MKKSHVAKKRVAAVATPSAPTLRRPPETLGLCGDPGKTLYLDGALCTITELDWEREESPQLVNMNGRDLPPVVVALYRCRVDIKKPDSISERLIVHPPFLNTEMRMTPVAVKTIPTVLMAAGLSGKDTYPLTAFVQFVELDYVRPCFVEHLPPPAIQKVVEAAAILEEAVLRSTPPRKLKWCQNLKRLYADAEGATEEDKWRAAAHVIVLGAKVEAGKPESERHSDYLTNLMLRNLIEKVGAPGADLREVERTYTDTLRRTGQRAGIKRADK